MLFPATTCYNGGQMTLVNGTSTCHCPTGFSGDNVLFAGFEPDCALSDSGLVAVYIVGSITATCVGCYALYLAIYRKPSSMRIALFLTAAWNLLIPIHCLSHFLEGRRLGPVSIVFLILILQIVHIQITIVSQVLLLFLVAINRDTFEPDTVVRAHRIWLVLWSVLRFACVIAMWSGLGMNDYYIFNRGILAMIFVLLSEITATCIKDGIAHTILIKSILRISSELSQDAVRSDKNSTALDFANRVKSQLWVPFFYGTLIFCIGIVMLTLFFVYGGHIPFAWVIWSILIITWPTIGCTPVILLRSKLGQTMERSSKTVEQDQMNSVTAIGG